MSTIYLVSGGARSGKSGYAQSLCEYLSPDPIYLATSEVYGNDTDFAKRVLKHQQDRGDQWTTIEEPLEPSKHLEKMKGKVVLVDCCTLWLTNYMMKEGLFSLENDGGDKKDKGDVQDASERALKNIEEEVRPKTKSVWNGKLANENCNRRKSILRVFFLLSFSMFVGGSVYSRTCKRLV